MSNGRSEMADAVSAFFGVYGAEKRRKKDDAEDARRWSLHYELQKQNADMAIRNAELSRQYQEQQFQRQQAMDAERQAGRASMLAVAQANGIPATDPAGIELYMKIEEQKKIDADRIADNARMEKQLSQGSATERLHNERDERDLSLGARWVQTNPDEAAQMGIQPGEQVRLSDIKGFQEVNAGMKKNQIPADLSEAQAIAMSLGPEKAVEFTLKRAAYERAAKGASAFDNIRNPGENPDMPGTPIPGKEDEYNVFETQRVQSLDSLAKAAQELQQVGSNKSSDGSVDPNIPITPIEQSGSIPTEDSLSVRGTNSGGPMSGVGSGVGSAISNVASWLGKPFEIKPETNLFTGVTSPTAPTDSAFERRKRDLEAARKAQMNDKRFSINP